jgi:hypothetical protein
MKKLTLILLILLILLSINISYAYTEKDLIFQGTVVRVEYKGGGYGSSPGTLIFVLGNRQGFLISGSWFIEKGEDIRVYNSFLEGEQVFINGELLK